MILGIGTDLVDIDRIERMLERYGPRFAQRLFTAHERQRAQANARPAAIYAKRFAAKEAVVKALGTGFRQGISWQDIEVVEDDLGKPLLRLHGKAAQHLDRIHLESNKYIHLSLSDEPPYALAFVVIEIAEKL
ncbi:MAG: holo-ACP synthase [Alphaproteobacteria bacterium]|nr:MAG: holo-ACP synthase [Alphaproteobacteria bacterium]